MTTLTDHIAHLRALAMLDPDTTALQAAMLNCLEEMAESLDGLRGRLPQDATDPPDDGPGMGSV